VIHWLSPLSRLTDILYTILPEKLIPAAHSAQGGGTVQRLLSKRCARITSFMLLSDIVQQPDFTEPDDLKNGAAGGRKVSVFFTVC